MHRDFQGFALENEGIFHFGMPLAGCGGLWYSDFVGIWHGCVNASWVVLPTQLIPARGRKPFFISADIFAFSRHNLSPQGDGNRELSKMAGVSKGTQLIPARGRRGQYGGTIYYVITLKYYDLCHD